MVGGVSYIVLCCCPVGWFVLVGRSPSSFYLLLPLLLPSFFQRTAGSTTSTSAFSNNNICDGVYQNKIRNWSIYISVSAVFVTDEENISFSFSSIGNVRRYEDGRSILVVDTLLQCAVIVLLSSSSSSLMLFPAVGILFSFPPWMTINPSSYSHSFHSSFVVCFFFLFFSWVLLYVFLVFPLQRSPSPSPAPASS